MGKSRTIDIALVTGDGAAPEMMTMAMRIAEMAAAKSGVLINWIPTPMGWNAFEQYDDTLPAASLKTAMDIGTVFFGGVGDPALDNTKGKERPDMKPESKCLLALRGRMGLLLNFRPIVYYPALHHLARVRGIPGDRIIEQHWVRFLLEDTYFGNKDMKSNLQRLINRPVVTLDKLVKNVGDVTGEEDYILDLAYYSKVRLERYFRHVLRYAMERRLPLLCVDKANMMPRYVLWRKTCERIHGTEFPEVEVRYGLVDSVNQLLFHPEKLHGVIACGNEHGDILTDGAAECVGSLGMMCSASVNPETRQGMFESGAGTAPTLKGKDAANPIGRILTAALMLEHLGIEDAAERIRKGVHKVLRDGHRTADIAQPGEQSIGCSSMAALIAAAL